MARAKAEKPRLLQRGSAVARSSAPVAYPAPDLTDCGQSAPQPSRHGARRGRRSPTMTKGPWPRADLIMSVFKAGSVITWLFVDARLHSTCTCISAPPISSAVPRSRCWARSAAPQASHERRRQLWPRRHGRSGRHRRQQRKRRHHRSPVAAVAARTSW